MSAQLAVDYPYQTHDDIDDLEDINEALAAIKDPECRLKSLELLSTFKNNLALLKHSYLLLDETEFYLEGAKAIASTQNRVKAVDPFLVDWNRGGALSNYYQANVDAVARGVQITRIFVISRRDSLDQSVQQDLYKQSKDGIDVRITFREDLPAEHNDIAAHSLDFAIYNDALVTDRGLENGSYFGKKTKNAVEIDKYLRLFNLIEQYSKLLSPESILDRLQLIDGLPI